LSAAAKRTLSWFYTMLRPCAAGLRLVLTGGREPLRRLLADRAATVRLRALSLLAALASRSVAHAAAVHSSGAPRSSRPQEPPCARSGSRRPHKWQHMSVFKVLNEFVYLLRFTSCTTSSAEHGHHAQTHSCLSHLMLP